MLFINLEVTRKIEACNITRDHDSLSIIHKSLFESDGKPNSKGLDLLKKKEEMMQSFYEQKGLEGK